MLGISVAYAVMRCLCVCMSVCLSRSWIVSKLINKSSKVFHRRVDPSFSFFSAKRHRNIPAEPPPLTGASSAGGVGRNRDSEPISGKVLSTGSPVDDGHLANCDTSLVVSGGVNCGRWRRNVYDDKTPQRYAKDNRTAHLTARSDKSVAYVTNNKRLYSTCCTIEANYWQTI